MAQGTIKWYSTEKRFGFIVQEEGEDMFFHKYFNLPMHPRLTKTDCDAMVEGVALAIKLAKKGSNGH